MIVCAGKIETFNFATPVGIGLTDVSINLTKLCMEKKPEFLLFVGSAGSYGEKHIFEIIESKTACNIENSFLEGHSYTPIDNVVSAAQEVSRETLVNCSNYVTSNSDYAKQYLEKDIHLENMEFYAVLKVAEKFGIPAGGVFVVTNFCDENAHEDFKKNHKKAMQKLAAYMNEKNKELRV
ncbi:MAG: purine-nucleoside phosphorylase [Sulfurimonas sp.]